MLDSNATERGGAQHGRRRQSAARPPCIPEDRRGHRGHRGGHPGAGRGPIDGERAASGRHRDRASRLRLHGRRHQDARSRIHLDQSGLELPQHPRIARQLRRQQEAGAPHLHARGSGDRDGARLRQGGGKAHGRDHPRHGRPAARLDGDLQRVGRPRADHAFRGQRARRDDAPPGNRMESRGAGRGLAGARLRQVGRHADVAAAFRRVDGARLQDRHHAAHGAGAHHRGHRLAGERDPRGGPATAPRSPRPRSGSSPPRTR